MSSWFVVVCVECVVECIDDTLNQVTEEVVDPSCGLHMSCTSSFANFGTCGGDQADQGFTFYPQFTGCTPTLSVMYSAAAAAVAACGAI